MGMSTLTDYIEAFNERMAICLVDGVSQSDAERTAWNSVRHLAAERRDMRQWHKIRAAILSSVPQ